MMVDAASPRCPSSDEAYDASWSRVTMPDSNAERTESRSIVEPKPLGSPETDDASTPSWSMRVMASGRASASASSEPAWVSEGLPTKERTPEPFAPE